MNGLRNLRYWIALLGLTVAMAVVAALGEQWLNGYHSIARSVAQIGGTTGGVALTLTSASIGVTAGVIVSVLAGIFIVLFGLAVYLLVRWNKTPESC